MKEFQKLHHRVIDYNPPQDLSIQAALLLRKLEIREAEEQQKIPSLRNQPIYKLRLWFRRDIDTQRREVIRFMSDEEELHNIASPQGPLVNGEVGCRKSMLMDIFANCLPHHSKMRWHFSNFILWVYGEIHQIQKERMLIAGTNGKKKITMQSEFICLKLHRRWLLRAPFLCWMNLCFLT